MLNINEKLRQLVVLFITSLCLFASAGIASAETPLEGAWLLTETQDSDGNVDSEPLRGLVIFTSTHYSLMYAIGEKPRALMDEENPSDEQTINAYESIIANSGRYDSADRALPHPQGASLWDGSLRESRVTIKAIVLGDRVEDESSLFLRT